MQNLHNPHLGDIDTFIKENSGLVAQVAKRSFHKTRHKVEFDDLMQEGFIGLTKAYCNYTPEKNTTFSTYAYYHISNQIMRYIAERVPMIRVPRYIYEISGMILRMKLENATPEEVSEKIPCSLNVAKRALDNLKGNMVMSLNTIVAETDTRESELMDTLPHDDDFTNLNVEEFIKSLNDELREVLLLALKEKSQMEIGVELGFSQAQAWRLMNKIRKKARDFFDEGIA